MTERPSTFPGSRISRCALTLCCILAVLAPLRAVDLYYDTGLASPSVWFGDHWSTNSGGPFTSAWADDSTAIFNVAGNRTVNLSADVSLTGLQNLAAGTNTVTLAGSTRRELTFAADSEVSGRITFSNLDLVGNFELTGGVVQFNTDPAASVTYAGTATVTSGTVTPTGGLTFNSPSANFVVEGGFFRTGGGTSIVGAVTVNSGLFDMGAGGATPGIATVSALAGSGGTVTVRTGPGAAVSSLTINQATNTTFSGILQGVNSDRRLTVAKSNVGTLILDGPTVNLRQGLTIDGGTLLINGAGTRNFDHEASATAISVAAGGTFGGTSILNILNGDNVVVADGGLLAVGNGVGGVGRTTFAFDEVDGGSLNLSTVTTSTGWLRFDLASDASAGTSYDQIRLVNGTLNIGSGILNFNDFDFNPITGFGVGTYTLFELTGNAALAGTLGSDLTGNIGIFSASLSLDGNDNLILSVIPEPSALGSLLLAGGLLALGRSLRNKRKS